MNTRLIALTCAFVAAACGGGGSDTKPAQDPTAMSGGQPSSSAPTTTTTTSDSSASGTGSNASGMNATGSNATGSTATKSTAPAMDQTPASAAPPPPPAANATNNPGVADQTKNADNTKINDRDRHGALTPMDQGNSGSEIKITAAIRKGLMGDKSLSFNAKNVKVVTVGTKVTLRGPVKTDQEKSTIEMLAKQTAGVTDVDNQLEVKK